jgi:hypothetical protein
MTAVLEAPELADAPRISDMLQLAYTSAEAASIVQERTYSSQSYAENLPALEEHGRNLVNDEGHVVDNRTDLAALVQRHYTQFGRMPVALNRVSQGGYQTEISPDLVHFCRQHDILTRLPVALALVEQCFSSIQGLELVSEEDPETGEVWLVIDVTVHNEINEVLAQYDTYTDQWVAAVPWPDRSKIRLAYNIV